MSFSRVAIVGRPNVGKSSLLNRIVGRRVAIVEPTAGVTRDRVDVPFPWRERRLLWTDTGGVGLVDESQLERHIAAQIEVALELSEVILFVVDGKEGAVPGDELVARRLRRLGKPIVLVVNKVESHTDELAVHAWQRLGFGEPFAVSALEGFGITDLCDRVLELLPAAAADEPADEPDLVKFAVVGKRNSGKSTLVNHLVGQERVIVSELPGTTRDSIDVAFEYRGRRMLAIDTAGVRKKSRLQDAIELFSYSRATDSIRRADVVLHLFDVREPISQVDKRLAHYAATHYKPLVLVGNKIDLAGQLDLGHWDAYIRQQLAGQRHAPVSFISATEETNVEGTLDLMFELHEQAGRQLPTGELNRVLQEAKTRQSPKGHTGTPKLFYATQIGTRPVSILVFVNQPKLFRGQYERYLQNVLRREFQIAEVPIRLVFRARERTERRGSRSPDSDPAEQLE